MTQISGFSIYAYCLLSNHVHLLIKAENEPIDLIMKRTGTRYVAWFNKRYDRVGHLFRDRFRSENVEDDCYFLTVLRYIIQNPMKAGLEEAPGKYPWSSYRSYFQGQGELADVAFGTTLAGGRENIIQFLKAPNTDIALDISNAARVLSDTAASEVFRKITKCKTPMDFQKLPNCKQRTLICELHNHNLSIGQTSLLAGRPKSTVYATLQRVQN